MKTSYKSFDSNDSFYTTTKIKERESETLSLTYVDSKLGLDSKM